MIYYVNGDFIEKTAANVIIDCGGIGYNVQISLTTYADIETLNKGRLYTYHLIREDAELLFGFSTKREKVLFELLISVSGVGANTARMILSSLSPNETEQAILSGNSGTLQGVKGIGAKTAQRIVIDLKDKIAKIALVSSEGTKLTTGSARLEAHAALITLGITAKQAEGVLNKALNNKPEATTEELVRIALQLL